MQIPIEPSTLPNGLRVILAPNHDLPVVAVVVAYAVGSVDEEPGKSGFAHLFEHLMFQGSENVPRNGHFKMVEAAGGTLNAFTSKERTMYYDALPSHQLALGLWLEADRMRSLAITQENFDLERQTVKEERRQTYDNKPYGRAHEALEAMAHEDPAYAHSVIGSMRDLDRASLDDVRDFFRRYYTPRNATLVVAGDIRVPQTLALVARYFGDIVGRPRPRRRLSARSSRKPLRSIRVRAMHDRFAELPALLCALPAPSFGTRAWCAARLLRQALVGGDSSRLYMRLVKGEGIAVAIQGEMEKHRGPGLLMLHALVRPSRMKEVRAGLFQELEILCEEPLPKAELDKAKNQVQARFIGALSTSIGRAVQIATLAELRTRADAINTEIERHLDVTAEDAVRAARSMFHARRSVITVMPVGRRRTRP